MKCPGCGADVSTRYCSYCGREVQRDNAQNVAGDNSQQTVINNYYYGDYNSSSSPNQQTYINNEPAGKQVVIVETAPAEKEGLSRLLMFFICLFLGNIGVHHFITGNIIMGLVYLFTGGLCGIGWVIDLIRIAVGAFPGTK